MELDVKAGRRPAIPIIDITNNLIVDDNDVVTVTINGQPTTVAVSGIGSGLADGMILAPAISAISAEQEIKYSGQSSGRLKVTGERGSGRRGRITWREINQ
jgi:hypothetical protein